MEFRIIPELHAINPNEYRSVGFRITQAFDDQTFEEKVKNSLHKGVYHITETIKSFLPLAGGQRQYPDCFQIKEFERLTGIMKKLFMMLEENSTLNLYISIENKPRVAFMLVTSTVPVDARKLDAYIKLVCFDATLYKTYQNDKAFRTFFVDLADGVCEVPVLTNVVKPTQHEKQKVVPKFNRLMTHLRPVVGDDIIGISKQGEGNHEVAVIECYSDLTQKLGDFLTNYPVRTGWDFDVQVTVKTYKYTTFYFREWKIGTSTGFQWRFGINPDGKGFAVATPSTLVALSNYTNLSVTKDGRVSVNDVSMSRYITFDASNEFNQSKQPLQVPGAAKQFIQWVIENHPLLKKKQSVK